MQQCILHLQISGHLKHLKVFIQYNLHKIAWAQLSGQPTPTHQLASMVSQTIAFLCIYCCCHNCSSDGIQVVFGELAETGLQFRPCPKSPYAYPPNLMNRARLEKIQIDSCRIDDDILILTFSTSINGSTGYCRALPMQTLR